VRIGETSGAVPFSGKIYYADLATSIGGTPTQIFNPNQYNAANSQTQWVSTSGETWTINTGTATSGYKGALVTKTIVMGDGVDDKLYASAITVNQPSTIYMADRVFSKSTLNFILDGDNGFRNAFLDINSTSVSIFAGSVLNISNSSLLLKMRTALFNGANSSIKINNGTASIGDAGTENLKGLHLFSQYVTTYGNAIINTMIDAKLNDNSSVNTAMYDYIRSINGSAF
jgi:hypothetical protein